MSMKALDKWGQMIKWQIETTSYPNHEHVKWVASGNENKDNKRRVDSSPHVGNKWTLINNRRQKHEGSCIETRSWWWNPSLLAKMQKEGNTTKKKRGWSSPRQRCEARHPPSLPYELELFVANNLGHVCEQLEINNQRRVILCEFEPVGSTLLKYLLGVRWGLLLPTLQWVGSWLLIYLASLFSVK